MSASVPVSRRLLTDRCRLVEGRLKSVCFSGFGGCLIFARTILIGSGISGVGPANVDNDPERVGKLENRVVFHTSQVEDYAHHIGPVLTYPDLFQKLIVYDVRFAPQSGT